MVFEIPSRPSQKDSNFQESVSPFNDRMGTYNKMYVSYFDLDWNIFKIS